MSAVTQSQYRSASRYWREAATLIIAAGSPPSFWSSSKTCDYSLLMLKRSAKSQFMPHKYVYPGGGIHNADFSSSWKDLYSSVTGKPFSDIVDSIPRKCPRPPMMEADRDLPLPAEIAFRICAIREAFEEAGILLATKNKPVNDDTDPQKLYGHAFSLGRNTKQWRKRVQDNPDLFIDIFLEHNLVPDIWSLAEWSNWLTPVMKQIEEPPEKPHRFDTMFYICCLSEIPRAKHDETETVHHTWMAPMSLLRDFMKKKIELAGPQVYEPARMAHFQHLKELCTFSQKRQWRGLSRILPVLIFSHDGVIIVYDGDDLFPDDPDVTGTKPILSREETLAELEASSKNRNRMTRSGSGHKLKHIPDCNVMFQYGHLRPLSDNELWEKGKL